MAALVGSAAAAQEHKGPMDQHKMGKDKMGKTITVTGCVEKTRTTSPSPMLS